MKPEVVITNWVHSEVREVLNRNFQVVGNPSFGQRLSQQEILKRSKSAFALMAFMSDRVDVSFLSACPNLKIIAGALKGYDNFDVQACTEHGVWMSIVPDLLTQPTAELIIGLIIGIGRHLLPGDQFMRSGSFVGWEPRFYGTGLAGRTVGIIGMGAVGQAVAERLQGFACSILYYDPADLPTSAEQKLKATKMPLDGLLAESDYLLPLVPLTPETNHLLNAERIARMKPGSYLINACRGSVVEESAVSKALQSGHLNGYAADVFEMEDWLRRDRPAGISTDLLQQSKTLFTPHLGSAVDEIRRRIALEAAQNILDLVQGKTPRGAVNKPVKLIR